MTTNVRPTLAAQLDGDLQIVGAESFFRVGQAQFGMPGLIAIESVGPFMEIANIGPFLMIHDAHMDPDKGIGHHPHRTNERLFYIIRGQIEHDDALNGIRGTMHEGDLARLTEGERGMLHQEWNGRSDVTTHAFILVYTPDVEPPIPVASFNALRASTVPVVAEADGVATKQLIGGSSEFSASNSAITGFFDSSLEADATLDIAMPPSEGLILYPIEGAVRLVEAGAELRATTDLQPEGPDAMAVAWSDAGGRTLRVAASDGPARLLRVGFRRGEDDLVLHQPWRSRE
ncbi:MAG: pirin family protein [Candidatus Limnocylindria bacterium]